MPSYRCPRYVPVPEWARRRSSLVVLLPSARCGMMWAGGDCVRGYITHAHPCPCPHPGTYLRSPSKMKQLAGWWSALTPADAPPPGLLLA